MEKGIKVIDLTSKNKSFTLREIYYLEEISNIIEENRNLKLFAINSLDDKSQAYKDNLEEIYHQYNKAISDNERLRGYLKDLCNSIEIKNKI